MLRNPNVLLLSGQTDETAVLQDTLSQHVILTPVHTIDELVARLDGGNYDALFCASSFQTGTWIDVLEEVQIHGTDLPIIILGTTSDETEWLRVLEAGAFDLLVPPYAQGTLLAVLEQASASREARVESIPCC
jgi:DNA-binding NtrC family response regulator